MAADPLLRLVLASEANFAGTRNSTPPSSSKAANDLKGLSTAPNMHKATLTNPRSPIHLPAFGNVEASRLGTPRPEETWVTSEDPLRTERGNPAFPPANLKMSRTRRG